MDDDVELRRLRERVYGVAGARATPAMIVRLAELEDRARPVAGSGAGAVSVGRRTPDGSASGCASAEQPTAVFDIVDGLAVVIGDPDGSEVDGIPIRLSESVTASVAR
ncbi:MULTISPECIES: hypothetical protein [Microbacterium]|uniref:hypothetical protein n=1 Tax=Microbacterium TaxID=33882 RepID=UPI00277FDE3A|nr:MULTISPECIES: hypothetical protein [Microbacterium]MDQ1082025.1 hypothetical protein [Microbacterium sp. SORGH_AS_0344]MDQ1169208.1 hypothetical protein [Microbacterium proteolyticum]